MEMVSSHQSTTAVSAQFSPAASVLNYQYQNLSFLCYLLLLNVIPNDPAHHLRMLFFIRLGLVSFTARVSQGTGEWYSE